MTPRDLHHYPNLTALLDARRRLAPVCQHCGLVNAAWGTSEWTREHPSCSRASVKRLDTLNLLRKRKEATL